MENLSYTIVKDPEELEILRNRSSFNYTYDQATIELLKKNLQLKDSLYILVKNNDKFLAFCSIDTDWWEDGYFFLREILVDPSFQKHNMGTELMGQSVEHAKTKGAKGIVTETAFENIPMQKLCAKFQFQEWNNPKWKEGITYKLMF